MKSTGPLPRSICQVLSDLYRPGIAAPMLDSEIEDCFCAFSDRLEELQYKLSRYINALTDRGLLGSVPQGKWIYHSVFMDHRFQKKLHETIGSFPKSVAGFDKDLSCAEKCEVALEGGRCPIQILSCNGTARTAELL